MAGKLQTILQSNRANIHLPSRCLVFIFYFPEYGNNTVATALAFFYAQQGLNTQITITFLLNLIELNRQFNIALNR
jgi:hypothetical protein